MFPRIYRRHEDDIKDLTSLQFRRIFIPSEGRPQTVSYRGTLRALKDIDIAFKVEESKDPT